MPSNHYDGETSITLYHVKYPVKVNMSVIAKFQSETGADYMQVAIKAINAIRKAAPLDPLDQSEMMTSAVNMEHAAWLFYIAAYEMNNQVSFGEIQEAVLKEGPLKQLDKDEEGNVTVSESYPVIFANLVMFATLGVVDTAKKP